MDSEQLLIDLPEELVGDRIRLRPYRPGDGSALFEAVNSSREHLQTWLAQVLEGNKTLEESEANVRRFDIRWRTREDLLVGIWDKGSGRLLGGAGLHRIDWRTRRFEIGYWIRADAHGQGYVTEAVQLLCALSFGVLDAKRVLIRCAVGNTRSAAIPRRLGFRHEGTLCNEGMHHDGRMFDVEIFALTPEGWRALS